MSGLAYACGSCATQGSRTDNGGPDYSVPEDVLNEAMELAETTGQDVTWEECLDAAMRRAADRGPKVEKRSVA